MPAPGANVLDLRGLGLGDEIADGHDDAVFANQHAVSGAVWEMLEQGWAKPEDIDVAVKTSLGIRLPVVGVVQTVDFTGLDLAQLVHRSSPHTRASRAIAQVLWPKCGETETYS